MLAFLVLLRLSSGSPYLRKQVLQRGLVVSRVLLVSAILMVLSPSWAWASTSPTLNGSGILQQAPEYSLGMPNAYEFAVGDLNGYSKFAERSDGDGDNELHRESEQAGHYASREWAGYLHDCL